MTKRSTRAYFPAVALILATLLPASCAFMTAPKQECSVRSLSMSQSSSSNSNKEEPDSAAMMDEISWRAAKIKLEEQNTRSFLKRKPIKLPYLDARRWVQYNLGPDTKEEFDDLVANGNLRTPYIPKKPEEYYTGTGDWVSWDHFLTMDPKVLGREVPPATGRFD